MFVYEKHIDTSITIIDFFHTLKTKDGKIRENCNLLIKVKFHELESSAPLIQKLFLLRALCYPLQKTIETLFLNIQGCHIITYSKKIRFSSVKKNKEFQIFLQYRPIEIANIFIPIFLNKSR